MNNETFSFCFNSDGQDINMVFEATTWLEALTKFKSLIQAAYGYSIEDQISVHHNDYDGSWTGPIFGDLEDPYFNG